MANVFFKRGTLSSLNNQPINNGTIYITTDERAMYVDIGEDQRIRLGDFVEYANWAAITAIENPNPHSLYYANSENILAKWDATKRVWAQVNGQVAINNLISRIDQSADTANDVTTVTTSILDRYSIGVNGTTTYTSSNTDLLKITSNNTTDDSNSVVANIVINPANLKESASFSTEAINKGVKININNKQTGTDASGQTVNTTEVDPNPINLIASTGLTITKDATGNIVFTGSGNYVEFSSDFDNNGNLNLALKDTVGTILTPADPVIPTITYGKTSTSDAIFASGTAVLDVYTTGQVDTLISNQLKALDAMTFRGTLGATAGATVSTLPTTNVQNGDTYKVVTAAMYNGQNCRIGDMFIAAGVETDGYLTEPINWTYIPSGSDETNRFFFTYDDEAQVITFEDSRGILTVFEAGTNITFSGEDSTQIAINHSTVERNDTVNTAVAQNDGSSLTFNAVTGVTSDSTGHITGITTTPITVKDTINNITNFEVSKIANNDNSVSTNFTIQDRVGQPTATDTIQSSSLDLSVADNKTVIDLVWGTF